MNVISFFSFKGGVGRTALMTNLGAYWASQGKVVLLMDLDLSAPGLSYSLQGKLLEEKGIRMGMSDLLSAFYEQIKEDPNTVKLLPPRFIIRQVQFEDRKFKDAEDNLFFIPAGHRPFSIERKERNLHDSFQDVISTIPGVDPEEGEGLEQTAYRALAYYMKEHLENWIVPSGPSKGKKIDYLLIDTRTGFEELVDLSLGYLADRMVLVSSLNEQNFRGLKMTLEALKEKRVPLGTFPLLVTVVFSPIPAAEDEQLFERMEKAQQIIAEALRFERSGQKEMAPKCFSIHYNQILSLQEKLLALERPKSLYGKEVITIAHHLDNETKEDDWQDDLIRDAQRKVMKLVRPTKRPEDIPPKEIESPFQNILFTDLPPWYWPLAEEDQEETQRNKILDEMISVNPNVEINREALFNSLCWSTILSLENKRKLISEFSKFRQADMDALIDMFKEERYRFMVLGKSKPEIGDQILNLFLTRQREWAIYLLKNEKTGTERFISASNDHTFPVLENFGKYWLFLAKDALILLNDKDQSLQLIERAVQKNGDKNQVAVEFLELFDSKEISELQLKEAETIASKLAPSELWLNFLMARNRIQKPFPDKEAAKELLNPLLEFPPENAKRCNELGTFLSDELPEIATKAEPILRKAIKLDDKNAYLWNSLGDLLEKHLKHYNEAEAAYRKAIELDDKYASPWNGLGHVLANCLDRYEESEPLYRKAIELDEKSVFSWYGLGLLLANHLNRFEEAEAAFHSVIELNEKISSPWNDLGLLQRNFHLNCEESIKNFKRGLELGLANLPIFPYLNMNLGFTYLHIGGIVLGQEHLKTALNGFDKSSEYSGNTLYLALLMNDIDKIQKYLPIAEEKSKSGDFDSILSVLYNKLLINDVVQIEEWKRSAFNAMTCYHEHYYMMYNLYCLAGLRPEAKEHASHLVAELLTFPEEFTSKFKDMKKPDSWYERYRPFAEGKSRGLGDPTDRHLFCKCKSEKE